MLEALMLVLLGMLIMALAALALAPLLWARAARVTTQRVQQDVHSAAFDEASEHVSQKYEGEIAQREGLLRSEIEQLEASRDKISSEATSRVTALEEVRTTLEQDVASLEREVTTRDAQLAESDRLFQALAENVRSLGSRADSLGREAADLGSRAEALSSEISSLSDSHKEIAHSLHPETAPVQDEVAAAPVVHEQPVTEQADMPEPATEVTAQPEEQENPREEEAPKTDVTAAPADDMADTQLSNAVPEAEEDKPPKALPVETSLSDRIRALREGVSA